MMIMIVKKVMVIVDDDADDNGDGGDDGDVSALHCLRGISRASCCPLGGKHWKRRVGG